MTITFVSSQEDTYSSATPLQSRTINCATGTRTHGVLLVKVNVIARQGTGTEGDVTGITWNGNALSQAVESGDTAPYADIWHLTEFGGGTHDVVVTFEGVGGGSPTGAMIFQIVVEWYDSDAAINSTPVDTDIDTADEDPTTVTVTNAAGDLIASSYTTLDNSVPTGSNLTISQDYDQGGNCMGAGYLIADGANETVGWDRSNSFQSNTFIHVVAAFAETAGGGTTINLDAATLSAAGQTLDPQPGAVSKALDAAALTASGQAFDVQPGAFSLSLDTAALSAAGQALTITPGAVSLLLDVALLSAAGQQLDVQAVYTAALAAAALMAAGQALDVQPGAVSTTLDAAALAAAGQALTITPGAISTTLDAAALSALGQAITISAPPSGAVSLDAAALSAAGQALDVQPGAVSLTLDAALLAAAGQAISISAPGIPPTTVVLQAALLTLLGGSISILGGTPAPGPVPAVADDDAVLLTGTFRSRYAAAPRPPNPWDDIARWLARLEASGRGWETRRQLEALDADDRDVAELGRLSRRGRRA